MPRPKSPRPRKLGSSVAKAAPKKLGVAKPSQRLAAQAPAAGKAKSRAERSPADPTPAVLSASFNGNTAEIVALEHPTRMKVRTKFVVIDKLEVPVVVGGALETRFHVKLAAAYEARSILNGLATEQGHADNRIFGAGQPEAAIVMVIHSKAIADTFLTGHAFLVDFTEVAPE